MTNPCLLISSLLLVCSITVAGQYVESSFLESDGNIIKFLSMGDWGSGFDCQKRVAEEMGNWVNSPAHTPISFLMALGDNFYEDGVANDTDPQWKTKYHDIYDPYNLTSFPWFAILGNHDYHQNEDAQIDYFVNQKDQNWIMPGHYFSKIFTFTSNGKNVTVQIIFLDTIYFAPAFSSGTEFANETQRFNEQLTWLTAQLQQSTADWLFVAGHYPIFSAGESGDTHELKHAIFTLLKQHKVDAYFAGHDHSLQHLADSEIQFYGSGSGGRLGFISNPPKTTVSSKLFAQAVNGFLYHELSATSLYTMYIDENGTLLHNYTQNAQRTVASSMSTGQHMSVTEVLIIVFIVVALIVAGVWAFVKLSGKRDPWKMKKLDNNEDERSVA
eukprot:TRINITY_DN4216_c0_g1_i1.p1 TRINITY_DN4216_c0_g1~~TRINITY_DN4216_c0_g1_i1.p1  ORF type:complete len:401 (+),score=96.11 TRINITY_DN4216_c0_g1_i1:50-1204(+)